MIVRSEVVRSCCLEQQHRTLTARIGGFRMIEINTKKIVEKWQEEIKERINKLNFKPALNIIQIGDKEERNIKRNQSGWQL